jgi:hypothetical protein
MREDTWFKVQEFLGKECDESTWFEIQGFEEKCLID